MSSPKKMPAAPTRARNASPPTGAVVLGNQLFAPKRLAALGVHHVYMREDRELCTYFRFHQQKIVFFLAAMRAYADELREAGFAVTYERIEKSRGAYEEGLLAWAKAQGLTKLVAWEIEDRWFAQRIEHACAREKISLQLHPSPMFVTSRQQFSDYLGNKKRPFMRTFYESQRKRLGLLMQPSGEPVGGQYSFDAQNRESLPHDVPLPGLPKVRTNAHVASAQQDCAKHFGEHPGDSAPCWLPTDRAAAQAWFKTFLTKRFHQFGPYEDALSTRDDVLFHSVLSPLLNVGLLLPGEVVAQACAYAHKHDVPLQSLEGFVRQVVGWREFVRGIYQHFDERQSQQNFFGHTFRLSAAWYGADTGIAPLDDVLAKVLRLGWAHHIERLMVLGNLMLLLEVDPREGHRWFMEMFVDSSDWVMGPNVYGMALFSDGGIFATKPYICGSNYLRKMGGYKKAAWCDAVDGLYWRFVLKHQAFFSHNPRMQMMVRTANNLKDARKETIFAAADAMQKKLTRPARKAGAP